MPSDEVYLHGIELYVNGQLCEVHAVSATAWHASAGDGAGRRFALLGDIADYLMTETGLVCPLPTTRPAILKLLEKLL